MYALTYLASGRRSFVATCCHVFLFNLGDSTRRIWEGNTQNFSACCRISSPRIYDRHLFLLHVNMKWLNINFKCKIWDSKK